MVTLSPLPLRCCNCMDPGLLHSCPLAALDSAHLGALRKQATAPGQFPHNLSSYWNFSLVLHKSGVACFSLLSPPSTVGKKDGDR